MFYVLENLIRALRGPSIDAQERAYLEGSSDRVDLEYRQREIDRGRFRPQRVMFAGLPASY